MADLVPIHRAILSVSDKTNLIPFAKGLAERGVELISTGGTAAALKAAGLKVTAIDDVTGFPEIMNGRVKTLHPKVHGGLLGVRDDKAHLEQMKKHDIRPIDLVCVNLYPFEQTVSKPNCTEEEAIENIDIGGPSMIRSASKNFEWVAVVTSPAHYDRVLQEMATNDGCTTRSLRHELAAEAFATTSRYDAAITAYMTRRAAALYPPLLKLEFVKADDLRYGENPHQSAAMYRLLERPSEATPLRGPTIAGAEQLHGKELSYNNINDASAALELALALKRVDGGKVGACVVKHTNPCGAAMATSAFDAIDEAIAGDPVAAYGGILAVNDEVDAAAAQRVCEKDVFLEVIAAPRFSAEALEMIRARWANIRLLAVGDAVVDLPPAHDTPLEYRSIPGGLLVQERDLRLARREEFEHRAGPAPSEEQIELARFLEATAKFLFSNAVLVGGLSPTRKGNGNGGNGSAAPAMRMFGAGAGQMDRVTACGLAVGKAGNLAQDAVAFSDAFFPFSDGPRLLIDAGVKTIVHPGGSKRDQETFDLCEARGVTCLTTGLRHFRH